MRHIPAARATGQVSPLADHDQAAQATRLADQLRRAGARAEVLNELENTLAHGFEAGLAELVRAEWQHRPEQIRERAAQVLARARRANALVLRVHPDDVARLGPVAQLCLKGELAGDLQVEADDSLRPGDVIVRCEWGELDARLEVQLARLREAFVQLVRR